MSVLNKAVSYFPGITATTQGVEVNLLTLLQSNKHKEAILRLRQSDEANQKQLKENLPCYTVAGTFSRRCDDGLIQLSGLAAVDLDSAQDYDVIHLLGELKKIDCIAYAGLSCRGQRLFCIVPFKYSDKYVKHYERLLKSFTDMGLPMGDDCHKRISQPRFVSWNDEHTQFFNHDAKPYHLLPPERTYHFVKRNYINYKKQAENKNPFEIAGRILEKKGNYFQKDNHHNYIFNLCCLLNQMGIPQVEAEQYIFANFLPPQEIKSNCITSPYKKYSIEFGTFDISHNAPYKAFHPQEHTKLLRQAFEPSQKAEIAQKRELQPAGETNSNERTTKEPEQKPENWDQEITEMEHYFETAILPTVPVKLNPYTMLTNANIFIRSHLAIIKANNGKRTFLPYLNRLQELKTILTINTN